MNVARRKMQLVKAHGQYCFFCLDYITANVTLEHLIAKINGGKSNFENTVIACGDCNYKVGDLPLREKIEIHVLSVLENLNNPEKFRTLGFRKIAEFIENKCLHQKEG